MRINKFVARATGESRRKADQLIKQGLVKIDGQVARLGDRVESSQTITINGSALHIQPARFVLLHKPVGYVSSRAEQSGSPSLYRLMPAELHSLKIVGRLDRESEGLVLLTNDGDAAQRLSHPSFLKEKHYLVVLNKPLDAQDRSRIEGADGSDPVVILDAHISQFKVVGEGPELEVTLTEGKNRQIRRTFKVLGYAVQRLKRTRLGPLRLGELKPEEWRELDSEEIATLLKQIS